MYWANLLMARLKCYAYSRQGAASKHYASNNVVVLVTAFTPCGTAASPAPVVGESPVPAPVYEDILTGAPAAGKFREKGSFENLTCRIKNRTSKFDCWEALRAMLTRKLPGSLLTPPGYKSYTAAAVLLEITTIWTHTKDVLPLVCIPAVEGRANRHSCRRLPFMRVLLLLSPSYLFQVEAA